jgi:signal transduction histidine kinase
VIFVTLVIFVNARGPGHCCDNAAAMRARETGWSPTKGLLVGMAITLAAVAADSCYLTRQIGRLRVLQTDLLDRNRKDSLQLLRIQNNLNSLGLAMRDMLDADGQPYPLAAWSTPLSRIRVDLEDALRREEALAVGSRTPEQRRYLADSLAQFWDAADRMFALARAGQEAEARAQIRLSLQARQAALATAVARLLVENNQSEEATAERVQGIYTQVERQVRVFLAATLVAIALTSLYLIRSNRRLFARLASLSEERREVAQQLITARESTLRHLARELHDEFGQTLTAMGSMLGRAGKHAPADSALRTELREIAEIAQRMLEQVRGLSQALHPSILEAVGLDGTVDWYLSTVERQTGLDITYERTGPSAPVDVTIATHVYRILQEALNNVARHAQSRQVWVRLRTSAGLLELDVEDHGAGMPAAARGRGLGLMTMRERAALVGGTIEFATPREGGTLVRVSVPLKSAEKAGRGAA